MRNLVFAILAGLVGALVLHIVIILTLPFFASDDVYSRISSLSANDRFLPASAVGAEVTSTELVSDTPYSTTYLCRFVLADAPIHLQADGVVPFWSLAVFDRRSNELFSMNDRTSEGGGMNVTLANPLQMIRLREGLPPNLAGSVLVETDVTDGYVLIRTVVPDQTMQAQANDFLSSATCREEPLAD
jgi:uncharacterized membrane protein